MGRAHYFFIDELGTFVAHLESRHYARSVSPEEGVSWVSYVRVLSNALVKFYSYEEKKAFQVAARIRVSYQLIQEGKPLVRLTKRLKALNANYRRSLAEWKTKRKASEQTQNKRWKEVERFLHEHGELIACFKYEGDERITEGNHSFNLEIASTPHEQSVCFEFIKALIDAYEPYGIVRGRRGPDKPREQRNGWIRRYAEMHKKRGWSPLEISREIQRELREGTWNERSRLQYNLSQNTILRIAGMKVHAHQVSYLN